MSKSFDHRVRNTATALVLALLATGNAAAQTADPIAEETPTSIEQGALEAITVTGTRQQYRGDVPLKALPQSIQVLTGETLAAAGITRLDNALDFASGISRQNNFGGLFDSFALRGFAGDENTASNYLVNGFNAARGYGGARDTSNVDRIEILKGPNSALFGRGEPGGTVNIITKKPVFDTIGNFTVSGGSYDTYRAEGDVNLPLAKSIAVRVTGAYEQADSFRDTIDSRKYTVTPSLLARLGGDTTLGYELEYIRQKTPFDRGIVAVNGHLKTVDKSIFLGEPGDGDIRINALGHQAQLQHSFSRNWAMIIGVGYRDTAFKGFSSEAELAAGRQRIYTDGQTLSRQRRYRDYSTTDATVRGELSGTFAVGGIKNHLLVGADWNDYELDVIQNRFRPAVLATQTTLVRGHAIDIFNPVYGDLPAVGAFQNQKEVQYSWGVYLQDQIDLTDRLKLRLGGRYDNFEQTITNRLTNSSRTGQTRTAFSPQAGLAYEVSDALTVYTSYGRGFRPNTGATAPAAGALPFTPEKTRSYEVGTKLSLLDNRLTGTVALFQTKKTNVLTADPVNAGFSLALGKAESKGVEFEMNGALPADFRILLAYSYIDAEVIEDALDPNFAFTLRKGDPLINIAKNSGSLLLFKDIALGQSKLTLGGGVNYVGKRLGETGFRFANGDFFMLPAYTLARLIAAFEPNEHIRFSGEVTNLFDKDYFPSSYSRLWLTPGAPRQFMLRAGYRF